jgi:putative ABC transport system permease protein
MLLTLIKKIMKNKWMYLCLLLGLVLSISIVVSIPMYSNASLARLLRRDLEDFKTRTMIYPGAYTMIKTLSYYAENIGEVIPSKDEDLHPGSMQNEENKPEKFIPMFVPQNQDIRRTLYETVTNTLAKEFIPQIGLPVVEENRTISVYKLVIKENIDGPPVNKFTFGKLEAIKSVANHIKIISGRMYTNKVNIDGAYEVVVSQETMKTLNLILDKTYLVNQPYDNFLMKNKYFKVKVVGVYDIKDPSDPFWMDKWTTTSYRSMLIDDELFLNDLFNNKNDLVVSEIFWGYALDYTKISPENINKILTTLDTQKISEMRKKYGI